MRLGVLLVPWGVPRLDLVDAGGCRRDTAPQTLTTQMAECALCHVEPTAMFGGIMELSLIGASFGLGGGKCVIQRGCGVGMPIGQHEADFLDMRRMRINQFWDKVRPIHFCSLLCDFGGPLARSRCKSHDNVGRTISLIFRVISERLPRLGRQRSPDCPSQLGRHCLSAYLGTLGIIRLFRDIEDVLPVADKSGILLRRNTPCFLLPRFTFIFCKVRRMVSGDTESTIANSTIVSARIRTVHRS